MISTPAIFSLFNVFVIVSSLNALKTEQLSYDKFFIIFFIG